MDTSRECHKVIRIVDNFTKLKAMAKQEYIFLPSNVKEHGEFPENLLCNYITKLDERKVYNRDWFVGLAEIHYTYSWKNTECELKFVFYKYELYRNDYIEDKESISYPAKDYKDLHEIIVHINTALSEHTARSDKGGIFFKVNEKGYVEYSCGFDKYDKPTFIKFPPQFWKLLGFDPNIIGNQMRSIANKYSVTKALHDIIMVAPDHAQFNTINALYVYTDICKGSHVGDSKSNLLRIVEFPNDVPYGKQLCFSYTNIFYHRLLTTEFDTIEIAIRDKAGRLIPFDFGEVIVVLDLREIIPDNNKSNNQIIEY